MLSLSLSLSPPCGGRATGGELQTLIDEQGHLSEQKTRVCMREILRALQHMHSKSIAHLDLKPQNILLAGKTVDGKGGPNPVTRKLHARTIVLIYSSVALSSGTRN